MANTKIRTVRIDEPLWRKARVKARRQGVTLSELLRQWLIDYVQDKAA